MTLHLIQIIRLGKERAIVLCVIGILAILGITSCQVDEIAISVRRDNEVLRFVLRYSLQSFQGVEVASVQIREKTSNRVIWEFAAGSPDSVYETGVSLEQSRNEQARQSRTVFLGDLEFGVLPDGFIQNIPLRQKPFLEVGKRYLVRVIGQHSQGLTEFTPRGECQKLSLTSITRDKEEFSKVSDC